MARPKAIIIWKGEERKLLDVCKELDRSPMLVRQRLTQGWDLEKALTTPSKFGNEYGRWEHYERWLTINRERNRGETTCRMPPETLHYVLELGRKGYSSSDIASRVSKSAAHISRILRKDREAGNATNESK